MKAPNEITLEEVKEGAYYSHGESWHAHVVLASSYVDFQLSAYNCLENEEYHNAVAEFNDHVFDSRAVDIDRVLLSVRDVPCAKISRVLRQCGFSEHEVEMILASVQEQCFLNIVQNGRGESRGYVELHFGDEEFPVALEFMSGTFTARVYIDGAA